MKYTKGERLDIVTGYTMVSSEFVQPRSNSESVLAVPETIYVYIWGV